MKITNSKKDLRDFGLLIGVLFPLIIGVVLPLIFGHSFRVWTIYVGIPFFTLGICYPKILSIPYKLWMYLGELLAFVNGPLVLGIIFFLILFPISILMKLFRYDPLRLNNKKLNSYRVLRKDIKLDFKRMF